MPFSIADNAVTKAFQNIGNEWALLSAGNEKHFNTMTISWGSLGFIWQQPVITVLVRPQRYTHEFMDEFENFSVSFYDRKYRNALNILGTQSGRDTNKIALSGLTPAFVDGVPTFKDAYLTVIAHRIYRGQMESAGFLIPAVDEEFYPKKDYHTVYFAELVKTVGKNQELVENQ
ncbi:flavin reductase [Telmatobacter bradus]|uniref:flavin reductase n=1 Tax=Telmatobacter bradus TaxID=474953 RepID=UPI003B431816